MSTSDDSFEYVSANGNFRVVIGSACIASIISFATKANGAETGGVLLGRYNSQHTTALVELVTGPPKDSASGKNWFRRGVAGLGQLLTRLWRQERRYYLGEWHFHPGGTDAPSGNDLRQMRSIANDTGYACPEPILLIFAGIPDREWNIGVTVHPRDRLTVNLLRRGR